MQFSKKITFEIDADDKATAKLNKIASAAKNIGSAYSNVGRSISSFSSIFSTELGILSSVASIATKGILTLGGALAIASGFAVKSAASYEQNAIAFETMLGSAEKASKLLQDISKFAKETPFQIPDVVQGSKQLLAYGFAQEEIIPNMKKLGDLSAGLNISLSDMTWLYGTTRVQGRLFAKDLYQFTNRGIPLAEELAKQFGVNKDKVMELVEQGKVGFPQVEKAINSLTSEGGKFNDLMIKQSKTLGGLFSNLQDVFGQFAREVIGISASGEIREGSIFAILKNGASNLYNYLEQNKETITRTVTDVINKAIEKVREWYESIGGKEGIQQKLTELWDTLNNKVFPALVSFIGIVKDVINWLVQNWDWLWKVVVAFEAMKAIIWVSGVIMAVKGLIVALSTSGLLGSLSAVAGFIFSPIGLVAAFAAIVAIITVKVIKAYNDLKKTQDDLLETVKNNNDALDIFQTKVGSLSTDKANEQLQKSIDKARELNKEAEKLGKLGFFGSVWSGVKGLFGKAEGGPVSGNTPYIVGEQGPEMFVPSGSGTIIPNNQMGGANFNFNFAGAVISDKGQLISEIKQAINRELELYRYGIG